MRIKLTFLLMLTFFCFEKIYAQDIVALQSQTKGPSIGLHGGFLSFTVDELHPNGTESGIGFGGIFQYGFNHSIAAAVSFQRFSVTPKSPNSNVDSYPYTEIELLAKFIFGSTNSKLRPNLCVGGNYTRSKESFYNEQLNLATIETFSGYGFSGGGGLNYFISNQLSIDLTLIYQSGLFSTAVINGAEFESAFDYSGFKGLLGLSYHF